ncbi:hypothetical protein PT974_02875 [Cladobotryum mycophilum]|uniref:Uncharacterized protein n=1 Tax=Cladobotryum mycophilum TaxID=491253 RepID=A0ABR0SZC8_9HYPO
MAAVAVTFWHVLQTPSALARILVGSSCGFWLSTTIFRILRIFYFGHSGKIIQRTGDADALQITVQLTHPIKLHPGCYFYIFFPAELFWNSHGADVPAVAPGGMQMPSRGLQTDNQFSLTGRMAWPAKGMGITATLPLALNLAARRHHDDNVHARLEELYRELKAIAKRQSSATGKEHEDLTQKRIEVFWSLESNEQMVLAQEQLKVLQKLDPDNKLLVVWCGFPQPRTGHAPFKESPFWMCMNPTPSRSFDGLIVSKLKEERRRLAGSLAVIASGDKSFMAMIRNGVVKGIDGKNITFIETEFQPRGIGLKSVWQDETLQQARAANSEQNKLARASAGSSYSGVTLHSVAV